MPSWSVFRLVLAGNLIAGSGLLLLVLLFGWGSRVLLETSERQQITFYAQQRSGQQNAIYLMDVPRRLFQRLYASDDWVFSMAWSPDGEQLAFIVQEQNTYHLYVMAAEGGQPRLVTQQAASSQPLHWSPDGRQIIFESYVATTTALYVADVASGDTRRLMDSANVISTDFRWSPDFQQAAFATLMPNSSVLDIYTVSAECVLQALNCQATQMTHSSSDDYAPVWSADGQKIAFISNRQGPQQIYIMDVHCATADPACDRRQRRLAPLSVNDFTLSWSPDNRWLLFSVYSSGAGSKLYLADMTCDDCDQRFYNLTPAQHEDIFAAWSPDSRYFLYVKRHQNNLVDIALLDMSCLQTTAGCTRASRLLTSSLYAWYPVWRP